MRIPTLPNIAPTVMLYFTFGYCDTLTFFSPGIFSAHIFANVILLVYQCFHGDPAKVALLLLSVPVFVAGLLTGRRFRSSAVTQTGMLKRAGMLLMMTGFCSALLITTDAANSELLCRALALIIVFTMAVTWASTERSLISRLLPSIFVSTSAPLEEEAGNSTKLMATGFVLGCLSGAVAADFVGLSAVMLPGVLLYLFTMND